MRSSSPKAATMVLHGLEAVGGAHRGRVVTIGNFDGVHLGHQKILRTVRARASDLGVPTLAVTFDPHPVKVLAPERELLLLTSPREKARLIRHFGVDGVLFINFTREFAGQEPEDFVREVLVGALGVRAVVVGHNYAFGKGKRGTTDVLRRMGRKYGFGVTVVRSARMGGKDVSSSRIRAKLGRGQVEQAAGLLGRPYAIQGKVVRGAGRGGPLLGTPTANIHAPGEFLPRQGVYAVRVLMGGRVLDGAANVGDNPTFARPGEASLPTLCEVHLLGYSGEPVEKPLRIYFIARIRDEIAFPDAESLREQIARDVAEVRAVLSMNRTAPLY